MSVRRSWPALALLLVLPGTLAAQRVTADISIGHGPVSGRVILGDHYHYSPHTLLEVRPRYRHRPVYHEVVVVHRPRGQGWYRRHGYRPVRIWYDYDHRRYYDGHDRNQQGLRAVVVYERSGRYYSDGRDAGYDRYDRTGHGGRNDDRWDRD